MNVIVCIKQVPDTETRIKIKPDGSGIDPTGVKWVLNPYDEFAVEEAVKLREAGGAQAVHVISVGPKTRIVEALRTALAMGADEAVAIDAPESTDGPSTALALAAAIKELGPIRAVFAGKTAIDDNLGAVPQQLAEALGLPHVTVVSKAEISGDVATLERETDGGVRERIQIKGPFVLSANKGLNSPRYASLPGIMKAKKKVIKDLSLTSLGVTVTSGIAFSGFQLPPEKPAVQMISGGAAEQVTQLVAKLRSDAKVI